MQHVGRDLQIIQLMQKVSILSLHLPLGVLHVGQGQVHPINLLVQIIEGVAQIFVLLLRGCLGSVDLFDSSSDLRDLIIDYCLVLVNPFK